MCVSTFPNAVMLPIGTATMARQIQVHTSCILASTITCVYYTGAVNSLFSRLHFFLHHCWLVNTDPLIFMSSFSLLEMVVTPKGVSWEPVVWTSAAIGRRTDCWGTVVCVCLDFLSPVFI